MVTPHVKKMPKWGKFAKNAGNEMGKCKKSESVSRTFLYGIDSKKILKNSCVILNITIAYKLKF
jgi:hypothetical protein